MHYSQSVAAIVAALSISGAVAGPTRRHVHHQHHAKRDYDVDWKTLDWEHMGIDWASAYSAGLAKASSTPAPSASPSAAATPSSSDPGVAAAAVTSSAAPVAASSSASDPNPVGAAVSAIASGLSSAANEIMGNVEGFANKITQFGQEVAASGNTGDFYSGNYGNPYGHNMMKVASKDNQQYTIEFINTSGKPMSIYIWNKVGSDGQLLSGSALAPKNTALTFALPPNAHQIVAFQENSQIAFAQACEQKAASGAFATTWGEANFVKTGSGYDVSAIMNPNNNNYDMTMTSEEAPQCTSDRTQNFWLTATQPIGSSDGSCFIAQNHAHITVKMGGTI